MFRLICVLTFIVSFGMGVISKVAVKPSWAKKYSVQMNDKTGKIYKDISYGDAQSNKFDLYVPADGSKKSYGLVVYLHAGGFTQGDKADDAAMLSWLCSKGYVAAGLFSVMLGSEIDEAILDTAEYDEQIKPISAFMWIDETSAPSVIAYGALDRVCPFKTAAHLVNALEENGVDFQYFEMPHSGHGLQNDNKMYEQYMNAVEEYLDKYMPVEKHPEQGCSNFLSQSTSTISPVF